MHNHKEHIYKISSQLPLKSSKFTDELCWKFLYVTFLCVFVFIIPYIVLCFRQTKLREKEEQESIERQIGDYQIVYQHLNFLRSR
jgi:hypothetical protein